MEFAIDPRRFAEIDDLPVLAALQVRPPGTKPTGGRRIVTKLARAGHSLFHRRLGLPARASLRLTDTAGGSIRVPVDARHPVVIDYCSRSAHGGYEPVETCLLDAMLPRVSCFFDIGANWGYYSLLAATNRGFAGKVYAFEIAPDMRGLLTGIVSAAALRSVEVMDFGLSDRNGPVAISDERNAHLTRVLDAPPGARGGIPAEVRRLDDLDLPPPDLVKIDVEGHERSVLGGAVRTITAARPAILFEAREPGAPDSRAVFDLLRGLGYRFHVAAAIAGNPGRSQLSPIDDPESLPSAVNVLAADARRLAGLLP